jgi:hypothetical protein
MAAKAPSYAGEVHFNVNLDQAKRFRTATHEAGHAVVIHACGLVVDHMQLFGESSGFTEPAMIEGQDLSQHDKICALGTAAVAGNLGVEFTMGEEEAAAERADAASSIKGDESKAEEYAQKVIVEGNLPEDVPSVIAAFHVGARTVLSTANAQQSLERVRDALLASAHGALCQDHIRGAIEGGVDDSACQAERKPDDVTGA